MVPPLPGSPAVRDRASKPTVCGLWRSLPLFPSPLRGEGQGEGEKRYRNHSPSPQFSPTEGRGRVRFKVARDRSPRDFRGLAFWLLLNSLCGRCDLRARAAGDQRKENPPLIPPFVKGDGGGFLLRPFPRKSLATSSRLTCGRRNTRGSLSGRRGSASNPTASSPSRQAASRTPP
jgi:hypothetical protein